MVKNPIKFWATPVTASAAPSVTAAIVETVLGIFGSMVAKLVEAMKVQKQVGASEAAANKKNITGARLPADAIVLA